MGKKIIITIICILVLLLPGIFPRFVFAKRIYFSQTDPKDDAKGTGTYTYPKNRIYNEGAFDIRKFEVIDGGEYVIFEITVEREPEHKYEDWVDYNGWVFQMMDIYIDTDRITGSGFTRSLPGRNVVFSPDSAWEKVVIVSPFSRESMLWDIKNKTEDAEFILMKKNILVPAFPRLKRKKFTATISKKELGEPKDYWGYQVLMLATSKEEKPHTFKNQEIYAFNTDMDFGGGSDYRGNPNVLDLLDVPGISQYEMLSNYSSSPNPLRNRFAVIKSISKTEAPLPSLGQVKYPLPQRLVRPGTEKRIETDVITNIPAAGTETRFERSELKEVVKEVLEEISAKKGPTPENDCLRNMKIIYQAARKYQQEHPEDKNITLLDLLYDKYLEEEPICPEGGRYVIYGEDTGKIRVRCINPTGVEHGFYPAE